MKSFRRIAFVIGLALLAGYGLGFAYVVWKGDAVAFTQKAPSYARDDFSFLTTPDGESIAYTYLSHEEPRGVILYSHGSAVDIGELSYILEGHRTWGFDVVCYDYPGIGHSTGACSEQGSYEAIRAVYTMLVEERGFSPEQVVLLGRSVGTAPSLRLATEREVGGLILVSPFLDSLRVATGIPLYPPHLFNNAQAIRQLQHQIGRAHV